MDTLSLSTPFARGRTADVFEWENGYILKLFHNWFSREDIEYELKIARAVHASGVRSPAVKEMVEVQGRNGLIYERVDGISMLKIFQQNPWKVLSLARIFARLHAQMHDCISQADIPKQRAKLQRKIQAAEKLPEAVKTSLLLSLDSLPDGKRVCHGDFHPDNILISPTDSTVIDWIDSASGNPLADVARTSIILLGAVASNQISNPVIKTLVRLFHSAYLREYFRLHPQGKKEYEHWLPIVAGARLAENIPELEGWLLEQAAKVRSERS